MHFGKMDRRITIQEFTSARDAEGGVTKSWSTGTQVWAQVVYERGNESLQHEHVNASARVTFTIRQHGGVTPDRTMRVAFNSTNFNIEDIQEIGRGEGWVLFGRADAI